MTPALLAFSLALQAPTDSPDLTSLAVLRAGDDACDLFNDPQRALLEASIARANDDAVLAGVDPDTLQASVASRTIVPRCTDARLDNLARDHLTRIERLATFTEITFQGGARTWIVDRRPWRINAPPGWRVVQSTGAGDAAFGVAQAGDEIQFVVAFSSDRPFASAVLVARDPERLAHPIDFTAGGLLEPRGRDGASAWGGSAGQTQRFVAADRLDQSVAANLAPASGYPAYGFTFTAEDIAALTALTPREGFAIDLRDRSGEVVSRIWFEVGAFQAALAMHATPLIEIIDEPMGSAP